MEVLRQGAHHLLGPHFPLADAVDTGLRGGGAGDARLAAGAVAAEEGE
jgi:hypothetical protein